MKIRSEEIRKFAEPATLFGLVSGIVLLLQGYPWLSAPPLIVGLAGFVVLFCLSACEFLKADDPPPPKPTEAENREAGLRLAGLIMGLGLLVAAMAWTTEGLTTTVVVASIIGVGGAVSFVYQKLRPKKPNLALMLESDDEEEK